MTPLELAKRYMQVFYSGETIDELRSLFGDEFTFKGPFVECHSADEYIASLKRDPPHACEHILLHQFETESSACLIYQFSKPGVSTPMAQVFNTRDGKIFGIQLIFDGRVFE